MDLSRFVSAQSDTYAVALAEIGAGRKRSHWMWFIFPQLKGLGRSERARYYGIEDIEEATAYLNHPILGPRLTEISQALLTHGDRDAEDILGPVDAMKLRSSATLFSLAGNGPFQAVLEAFFDGEPCTQTQKMLGAR